MKIASGIGENKNIKDASKKVNFEVILAESEEELMDMLINNEVDAAIRGSLNASKIMGKLRAKYTDDLFRASYLELNDHKFLFAPVGIDEGDNIQNKIRLTELGAEFLLKLGIKPKIAVLSGGRPQDLGRSQKIDDSIREGEYIRDVIKNKYSVRHYFILIEDAITDKANFILAPDGISGNLIFRTIALLGSGKSHGAITLGIDEIFIDTSRSQSVEGYVRALEFANYLARLKSRNKNGYIKTDL